MRRLPIAGLILLTACTAASDPDPTTSIQAPTTTTSSTIETTTTRPIGPTTTIAGTTTTTIAITETRLEYEAIAELPFPVQLTSRPGESTGYVITKDGRVWHFDGSAVGESPALDLGDRVAGGSEQGLLSVALHPEDSGLIYLHYSDGSGDTVVSEFSFISPTEIDPDSERVLLQVAQPAQNHNGGMIQFTPEGSLLLGLGDGGGAGDRFGNGQNSDTLLGGLVEIDVTGDAEPVKYAMGLRNPWRFWIDGEEIFIADVGQNAFEEVNVAPLEPGLNFGWPITEGLHCFDPPSGCDTTGQVLPVIEVQHGDAGSCSITGGVVYRGSAMPQLTGHYFYSDHCGGYLRSLRASEGAAVDQIDWTEQVGVPGSVTGFGIDGAGEIYVTTHDQLIKVVPAG